MGRNQAHKTHMPPALAKGQKPLGDINPPLPFDLPGFWRALNRAINYGSKGARLEERRRHQPCRQHFLYFLPLPQGQGPLRPILWLSSRFTASHGT